jgi:small-conductance mechanosensitive channel
VNVENKRKLMTEEERAFFLNGYLTLTSVIQATAFGLLAYSAQGRPVHGPLLQLSFLFCEFWVIVTLTYGYFVGARDLLWRFDGLDILIPFLVGLSEASVVNSLNAEIRHWFLFQLCVCISCFAVLLNGWIKSYRLKKAIEEVPKEELPAYLADHQINLSNYARYCILLVVLLVLTASSSYCSYHAARPLTLAILSFGIASVWIGIFAGIFVWGWRK